MGNSDTGNRIGLLLPSLILGAWILPGCRSQKTPPPVWEQAKIGELAVISPPKTPLPSLAAQIKLEVLAFEIPAENVSQLDEMWSALTSKGLRFKNHDAFRANGFRVGKGRAHDLSWVVGKLGEAQGVRVDTIALMLTDDLEDDIRVRPVSTPRSVHFTAMDGSRQDTTVNAGVFCWRVKAKKLGTSGVIAQFTAYPFFKIRVPQAIEELAELARSRQIAFMAAAFTTRLTVGDLIVVGPERDHGDQSTLGGLLLENPRGRLFYPQGPQGTPSVKPTLKILVFRCLAMR